MKLLKLLLFLTFTFSIVSKPHVRFSKVECNSSFKTSMNPFCSIRSYTRNNPLLSCGFDLKRKVPNGKVCTFNILIHFDTIISNFQLMYALYRKNYEKEFRSVLNIPAIEWCNIMGGFKSFPFFDMILKEVKTVTDDVFDFCLRAGEFKFSNYSFSKSPLTAKFPPGDYQLNLRVFDDDDDNIYNITICAMSFHWSQQIWINIWILSILKGKSREF